MSRIRHHSQVRSLVQQLYITTTRVVLYGTCNLLRIAAAHPLLKYWLERYDCASFYMYIRTTNRPPQRCTRVLASSRWTHHNIVVVEPTDQPTYQQPIEDYINKRESYMYYSAYSPFSSGCSAASIAAFLLPSAAALIFSNHDQKRPRQKAIL